MLLSYAIARRNEKRWPRMFESFLALIAQLIDLEKRREKVRRITFVDFVAPAMTDLESVHKDYLETFRRYRAMLEDRALPLNSAHPILAAIPTDNLFSEDLRAKVVAIFDLDITQSPLGGFLLAATDYLSFIMSWTETELYQVARTAIYGRLAVIVRSNEPDDGKRQQALELLDGFVGALQKRYAVVIREFSELRVTLLKPR
jgi:hypothetical protein